MSKNETEKAEIWLNKAKYNFELLEKQNYLNKIGD